MDVILVSGPNDTEILPISIKSIKRFVKNYRRIIVISPEKYTDEGVEYIDETIFPFKKSDIIGLCLEGREGWVLQQLLKLYAHNIIENLSENILVIDTDFILTGDVSFIEDNVPIYSVSQEYHIPYFKHMIKLHPTFKKEIPEMSGVSHHMVFNKFIINKIFSLVETHHGKEFWKVFVENLDKTDQSPASEYEIYFNFIIRNHYNFICRPMSDIRHEELHWYCRSEHWKYELKQICSELF
jgi:hypothetical protein